MYGPGDCAARGDQAGLKAPASENALGENEPAAGVIPPPAP